MAEFLRPLLRLTLFAAVLAASLSAGGAGFSGDAAAQGATHRLLRIVNDEPISTYDVNARLRFVATTSQTPVSGEAAERLRSQIIENLIDEQLQLQEAERLGITVEDAEIQDAVARIEQRNNMASGQLLQMLTQRRIDANTLIDQIRATLAWRKVVAQRLRSRVSVSEEDIDAYLEGLREKGGTEYLLGEIFIAANDPSELPRARSTAERLRQELSRGARFPEMARQFSQAATAGAGGDTGWIRADQLEATLAEAVKQLRPGEVSQPIGVADGYYLLALRDTRTFGPDGQQETVYDMRRVFLRYPAGASEQTKREILIRLARARPGLNNCEAVQRYATRAGDPQGGNMGEVRLSDLPQGLRSFVINLKPGEISQLLRLQDGALLMMVCERKTRSLGLPDRDAVRENLLQREADIMARRYMRELRQDAIIQTVEERT